MIEAVVGLLFSMDHQKIVLIRKSRPTFHSGLWNGPGGKIEPNETTQEAMQREFREETGLDILNWNYFARVNSSDVWLVHFFRAFNSRCVDVRTMTDEDVRLVDVKEALMDLRVVPNLGFLIPAALNPSVAMISVKDNEIERFQLLLPT